MSNIKSKNTTPELIVRRLLHKMGYRFRLHRPDLPGKPDIVLPKYKKVIFINGCFWHGHENCKNHNHPKRIGSFGKIKLEKINHVMKKTLINFWKWDGSVLLSGIVKPKKDMVKLVIILKDFMKGNI